MSQVGLLDVETAYPQIPTLFVTDLGSAIPIANTLDILGSNGLTTKASGKTVTVLGVDATAGATSLLATKGVSSFDSKSFIVTNGFVESIPTSFITDDGAPAVIPDLLMQVEIIGGEGIDVKGVGPGNTVTVVGEYATSGPTVLLANKGIVAFDSTSFLVTNGFVELVSSITSIFTAEDGTTAVPLLGNLKIVGTATNGISTTAFGNTMVVGMSSPYADGNFTFQNTAAATTRSLVVQNTDGDLGSSAALQIEAEATGGDAFVIWALSAATRYFSMGIDNSDNNYFKFTHNVNPSAGNTIFMVDPAGDTFTHYYKNILQTQNTAANGVNTIIQNTNNANIASDAFLRLDVGGASGGDPSVHFLVTGAGQYCMGIDNTVAGDPFKITDNSSPSAGTDLFTMTSTGVITLNNDLDVTEGGTGVSTLTSHGILMGNGAGDVQATAEPSNGQILIGKTTDFPQLGQLQPGMGIAISNGAGTITISAWGGGVSWTVETVNLNFTANKGIIANKAGRLDVTLPATGAIGDILEITGINTAVGWRIVQNANQQIHIGTVSTTVGVGGYVESINIRDSLKLVCVVAGASTQWQQLSSSGTFTVV
jgi:hypothetical protein